MRLRLGLLLGGLELAFGQQVCAAELVRQATEPEQEPLSITLVGRLRAQAEQACERGEGEETGRLLSGACALVELEASARRLGAANLQPRPHPARRRPRQPKAIQYPNGTSHSSSSCELSAEWPPRLPPSAGFYASASSRWRRSTCIQVEISFELEGLIEVSRGTGVLAVPAFERTVELDLAVAVAGSRSRGWEVAGAGGRPKGSQ